MRHFEQMLEQVSQEVKRYPSWMREDYNNWVESNRVRNQAQEAKLPVNDLDEGTELWDPEKMDLIKRKCGFCKKDAIIVNKKLHHWMKTNETDWGCVKLNRWEGPEKFLYVLDLCPECVKMHKDLHQEILND